MTLLEPEPEPDPDALRTTAIHPKCICVWKVANDRIGYVRVQHAEFCVVHRQPDFPE